MVKGFTNGAVYRHDSCLDIDLYIVKVGYAGPKYTKARVIYLNRHWQGGEFVIDKDSVVIKAEHYKHWKRIR